MSRHTHRRPRFALAAIVFLVGSAVCAGTASADAPTVFTVTTVADDGGTTCGATCSLRQAINAANLDAGASARIVFAIPSGPTTIAPLTELPTITHPIDIDGRTQADIDLDGSSIADPGANGFHVLVGGSGSAIAGLEIEGFDGSGILIDGAHGTVVGGQPETDPTGGNVIHGNGGHGVSVVGDPSATGNVIAGNLLFENGVSGIDIGDETEGTVGCSIGGTVPGPNGHQCVPTLSIGAAPVTTVGVHAVAGPGEATGHVELFWAPSCAVSESGLSAQATTYLGAVDVPLTPFIPTGAAFGDTTYTLATPLTGGFLTGTTTTGDGTSRLATCVQIVTPTAEHIDASTVPILAVAGQPTSMTFTMTNDGPYRDDQALLIIDLSTFPSTIDSATGPDGPCLTFDAPNVYCVVTGLDPGATATVTLDLTPTSEGTGTVTAAILHLDGGDPVNPIVVTIEVGGVTQVGTSVMVGSGGVDPTVALTFTNITGAGGTTITATSPSAPLPSGYALGGQAVAYDIVTTASHSGPITVCLSTVGVVPTPNRLLHYDGAAWVDITTLVDVPGQRICGTTTTLSPFVLASRIPEPDAPTGVHATAANHGATVTWVAPASAGSSPISGYVVTASPGGGTTPAEPTATSVSVTGLTNGISYTFTVVASNFAGPSQASAPSNAVVPAAPANQTITFANPGIKAMPESPVTVTPTASSGLAVTVTSGTPQVCAAGGVNGTSITLVSPGACTLVASQAGNGSWNPASFVSRTFLVSKATQTITFAALGARTMIPSSFSVAPTASSGLAVTVTSGSPQVCAAGGPNGTSITLLSVGACTLVTSQAGNGSWFPALPVIRIFAVSKASQTITFANPGSRSLASRTVVVSPSASSGLPVSLASATSKICSVSGTTITLLKTGTCQIVATQPGNAIYTSAPSVSQSFSVMP